MKLSKIIHFRVTDSTLNHARAALEHTPPHHCVLILAEEQTAGQGTHHRAWFSPAQVNIYATYAYLTSTQNDKYLIHLPQVAAFSVIAMLQEYGLNPRFKWANDVLLDGKKMCGILAKAEEKYLAGQRYRAISIGLGLNVNMSAQDLALSPLENQISSMSMSSGRQYDKQEVLAKLNRNLLSNIQRLYTQGFSGFVPAISNALETFNGEPQWLEVKNDKNHSQIVIGNIVGINQQGFLQLNLNGQIKEFFSGRLLKAEEIIQAQKSQD